MSSFRVARRYSQFKQLRTRLGKQLRGKLRQQLPKLPPKSLFGGEELREKRCPGLEHWLMQVLMIPEVRSSPLFLEFLQRGASA